MYEYIILYIRIYHAFLTDKNHDSVSSSVVDNYTVIVISSTWLVSLVLSQYSTPKSPCLMFIVPFPSNAQLGGNSM